MGVAAPEHAATSTPTSARAAAGRIGVRIVTQILLRVGTGESVPERPTRPSAGLETSSRRRAGRSARLETCASGSSRCGSSRRASPPCGPPRASSCSSRTVQADPTDLLVGVAMLLPAGIAAVGLAWPPVAAGTQSSRLIGGLAVGTGLILLPSLASLWRQIADRGLQTLLPSARGRPTRGPSRSWGRRSSPPSAGAPVPGPRARDGAPDDVDRRRVRCRALTATLLASVAVPTTWRLPGSRPGHRNSARPTRRLPPACDCRDHRPAAGPPGPRLSGTIDGRSMGAATRPRRAVRPGLLVDIRGRDREALGLGGAAIVADAGLAARARESWDQVSAAAVEDESLDLAVLGRP